VFPSFVSRPVALEALLIFLIHQLLHLYDAEPHDVAPSTATERKALAHAWAAAAHGERCLSPLPTTVDNPTAVSAAADVTAHGGQLGGAPAAAAGRAGPTLHGTMRLVTRTGQVPPTDIDTHPSHTCPPPSHRA